MGEEQLTGERSQRSRTGTNEDTGNKTKDNTYVCELSLVGTTRTQEEFNRFKNLFGSDVSAKVVLIASNGEEQELDIFSLEDPTWFCD